MVGGWASRPSPPRRVSRHGDSRFPEEHEPVADSDTKGECICPIRRAVADREEPTFREAVARNREDGATRRRGRRPQVGFGTTSVAR